MDEFTDVVNFMIPVPFEYVVEDEVVGQLVKRRRGLLKTAKRGPSHSDQMLIQEINEELATRVESLDAEAASWRSSLAPWLVTSMRFSLPSSEFSRDYYLRDLLQTYHHALDSEALAHDVGLLSYRIGALCLGIWVRGRAMRAHDGWSSRRSGCRCRTSSMRRSGTPCSRTCSRRGVKASTSRFPRYRRRRCSSGLTRHARSGKMPRS
ncbi:hypothetical protein STCU_12096 [Strigomonas culicis]|uniref:Uncharacterized protein n=1 Tax=Strigomonas culicis TaxID=28005 RepID=S9TEF3_9TRYP|nr:hypothetical protein STCU_12096 [Strigomonas culicis]|eukprot:EPY15349.1 hypothetical protein STCU_12096 [Strigomonas culicis]